MVCFYGGGLFLLGFFLMVVFSGCSFGFGFNNY